MIRASFVKFSRCQQTFYVAHLTNADDTQLPWGRQDALVTWERHSFLGMNHYADTGRASEFPHVIILSNVQRQSQPYTRDMPPCKLVVCFTVTYATFKIKRAASLAI